MARLIDADELKTHFVPNQAYFTENIVRKIEAAPTVDAVEVVRCRDCKHSYEEIWGRTCAHGDGVCIDCLVAEDFFCADGERREDGDV